MIWDLTTVHAVSRLRASAVVDLLAQQRDGALEAVRKMTGERLQQLAQHKAGVIVHMADISWREEPAECEMLRVIAAWRPATHAVEFRNGQRDGEQMIVQEQLLFKPIRFPQAPSNVFTLSTECKLEPMLLTHLEYDYTGWHESARRWIYTFKN